MIVYGVVRGKTVILPDDIDLPDGVRVEVHVAEHEAVKRSSNEARWLQRMAERGLLHLPQVASSSTAPLDDRPVQIIGKLLSETVLEERHHQLEKI